jgi:flagellar protein FlaG
MAGLQKQEVLMVVSNLTMTGSEGPLFAKVTGVTGTAKPATQGNALPHLPESAQAASSVENTPTSGSVPELSAEELHNLVDQANAALLVRVSNLKFTVAEGTDINVVRVEDTETGELIRQIPSEQMVTISRVLGGSEQGMMLEERV